MEGQSPKQIVVQRTVEGIRIPDGTVGELAAGAEVVLRQALGGSYTVCTDDGLYRIDAADADALGFDAPPTKPTITGPACEEQVWDVLRTIYDPEIPVNLVELGLIYRMELEEDGEGCKRAEIDMTLTAPACGMADVLRADVERRVAALPGISAVEVAVVFDPPWTRDRMSQAARLELGML